METTYAEFIQNILDTRGRFACKDEYYETHHIVPRCMGGRDNKDNLIDLFAREHFEAHRLLALENPDNEKLVYAWWCMSNVKNQHTNERYQLTMVEYEEAKIMFSQTHSREIMGVNNPMYGRTWWNEDTPQEKIDEWKKHLSESFSGANHPMYGKHRPELSGENHPFYGRPWWDENTPQDKIDEWRKHMSEARSGENNPMFGRHHTEEAKQKSRMSHLRENLSDETLKRMSQSHKGLQARGNNPRARKTIRLSDLKIYDCGKDAAIDNNINYSTFKKYCKSHKDFMYYDEWLTTQND